MDRDDVKALQIQYWPPWTGLQAPSYCERRILELRYGFGPERERRTLDAIGATFIAARSAFARYQKPKVELTEPFDNRALVNLANQMDGRRKRAARATPILQRGREEGSVAARASVDNTGQPFLARLPRRALASVQEQASELGPTGLRLNSMLPTAETDLFVADRLPADRSKLLVKHRRNETNIMWPFTRKVFHNSGSIL